MDAAEKLSQYSIRQATMHVEKGEFPLALEWIEKLSAADRPVNLYAEICYRLSCAAIAEWELKKAAGFINKAHSLNGDCYIYQKKAELLRKVPGFIIEDYEWESATDKIHSCVKLPPGAYSPSVDKVFAVGAYYAYGKYQGNYWCKLIRDQKNASRDLSERIKLTQRVGKLMARFLIERTDCVPETDWVVAVPPDPERYAERHNDIPTILGREIETNLAIPFADSALRRVSSTPDLRPLSKEERKKVLSGNIELDKVKHLQETNVLVVDDVTTHGTTFIEVAKVLKEAGVSEVFAAALAHTEG